MSYEKTRRKRGAPLKLRKKGREGKKKEFCRSAAEGERGEVNVSARESGKREEKSNLRKRVNWGELSWLMEGEGEL